MIEPGKKVLIITYYWPPSGGAGVQRWLKFAKYLREFNWEPIIYTAQNPEAPSLDESLNQDIPEGITVLKNAIFEPYSAYKRLVGMKQNEKVNAGFLNEKEKPGLAESFAIWLRGNFFIPDARRFWIKPSVKYLHNYLKENQVDIIVSTGPPHSMHLIAQKLHQKTRIPWLADFRDPWTGIDFYHQLKLSRLADKLHHKLEKQVLTHATEISVVSNGMVQEFNQIVPRKYRLVTNGFDDSDRITSTDTSVDQHFSIVHVGSINASRNPENLWKALSQLVQQQTDFAKYLKIKLIGKVDIQVLNSIEQNNLKAFTVVTPYIQHSEVMQVLCEAQLLLLLINNTPNAKGIVTGKLFEYLGSGRPILNIGPIKGDAASIISETNAGITVDYDHYKELETTVNKLFNQYLSGELRAHKEGRQKYSRRQLTEAMAGIFESMTR